MVKLKTTRVLCWPQSYAKDHLAGSLWPLGYGDAMCSAVMAAGVD